MPRLAAVKSFRCEVVVQNLHKNVEQGNKNIVLLVMSPLSDYQNCD